MPLSFVACPNPWDRCGWLGGKGGERHGKVPGRGGAMVSSAGAVASPGFPWLKSSIYSPSSFVAESEM